MTGASSLIRRRRLYEDVVERLERMIHAGELQPGDQLPSERELMLRFGVGRPAIREALFAMQRMGLVVVSNGERARVTMPTPETLVSELSGAARLLLSRPEGVRQFQQARCLFEVGLAQLAARHAGPADIERLRHALDANRRAVGDPQRFERTDQEFHFVLALLPRNPIFVALHEAIVEWLTEQRRAVLRTPGIDKRAYRSHERIFKAIEARDPVGAEAAMRTHLDATEAIFWGTEATAGQ
ncbi:MAG: transcriptional regulator NanR [Alphaproteobacteria bacterium]|nr:transcriptional regulator NanR [Alphaproteobacteria bacterium]